MSNFVELITLGFDKDDQVRNTHQAKIIQMRETHTEEFFNCSVQALDEPSTPEVTKLQILNVLSYSLKPSSMNQQGVKFYELCSQDMILQIQRAVTTYLVYDKRTVVQAAAQCLSAMYIQEQLHGRWDDFLVTIREHADSSNLRFKTSSILILGYICEDLGTENIHLRSKEIAEEILAGICYGLTLNQPIDEDILQTSLAALRNSIKFAAEAVFDVKQYRDHVMSLLVQIIQDKSTSEESKALCYQNIAEIADFFYPEFGDYVPKITDLSQIDLGSHDETLAIAVTQMWNQFALCEIALEKQRQKLGFIFEQKNYIVPLMMMNLTKNDGIEEDDENMQNTLYSTTVVTLENINKIIGTEIEEINMEFMERFIESKNQSELIAALNVYGYFVNYATKQKAASIFDRSASNLMNMLFGSNIIEIKIAVMDLLIKIATSNHSLLLSRNFLQQNLDNLIGSIHQFELRVVLKVFRFFEAFSDQVSSKKLEQTELKQNIENIVQSILEYISQSKINTRDTQYIDLGFKTILKIIDRWFVAKNINHFLPMFCEMLKQLGNIKTEKEDWLFDGLLICIQICLHKSYKIEQVLNQSDLSQLFQTLGNLFTSMRRIKPEGILTICMIGLGLGHRFESISEDTFNFMKEAMSQQEYNKDQMSAAILDGVSVIVRESRAFDENIMDQYIVSLLLHCFQNKEYPQEQRANLFNNLGDISFEYFMVLLKSMQQIYEIFKNAMEAVVKFISESDKSNDLAEYANSLKQSIIDSFLCIVHGFEKHKNEIGNQDKENFSIFISDFILKFIIHTCQSNFSPKIEYLLQCISLLSDIIAIDLNFFSYIYQDKAVQEIFGNLEKFKSDTLSDPQSSKDKQLSSDVIEAIDYFQKIVNKSKRISSKQQVVGNEP